ncbi:uncharacterized protein KY384_003622 [Bacidia gigantensis]|uniref:uncharacterized protein n=1 Tax=Bacidia gigantensis TaxID=2732470 RepID=UPI001D04FE57|nr:uncharacterized protein KY384_003622 [Bacidia gigantensis]KAG8531986.1 hypothetical protein KY384_003622 [Bacidia gigantensis]
MPLKALSPITAHASQDSKLTLPLSCDPPSEQNPPQQRVWVVFGASGHIGRSIVRAVLAHGDLATAVGKTNEDTLDSLNKAIRPYQPSYAAISSNLPSFSTLTQPFTPTPNITKSEDHSQEKVKIDSGNSCLFLLCDVRVRSSVDVIFQRSLEHWGRYDIVANCAGYGVIGACEDQDEWEIRNQFEVNFWGVMNIVQSSLPYFRGRGQKERDAPQSPGLNEHHRQGAGADGDGDDDYGGRYLIFSSTSGALGVPGLGPYCATKYAVEGLVESLLYETSNFDIRATLVEPGHVRRDDTGGVVNGIGISDNAGVELVPSAKKRSSKEKSSADPPPFGHFSILQPPSSSAYASPTSPAHHAKRVLQWLGEKQPTSAVKAAELVWQLGQCRYPPLRLLLGAFAVESVRERMRGLTEEIEDWRGLNFGEGDGEAKEGRRDSTKRGKDMKDRALEDGEGEEDADADGDGDEDIKMEDVEDYHLENQKENEHG